ncbi:DUF998 domain-containing protein [Rhizohabitans arisaemae]|uniref:DUF998 domain-containing protein n=1 Tax=Rhizohabitans arisaemae TaxID=2720610 RepID=UPI0024B08DF7|nr:DUF998 domain-containing protein [Rhizohabitans arisaemae]
MNAAATAVRCTPQARVTRSLLGYGIVAGPFYVAVSMVQGLTKDGFDFGRHAWSMMANGPYGWIQTANLILTGLMVVAFAAGLRRAGAGRVSWPVGAFGVGMVGGGVFPADPGFGFPAGTPDGPGAISVDGVLHFAVGGVGFLCLIVAAFLLARRFAPALTRIVAVVFLIGWGCVAAGGGAVWANLAFTASIIVVWGWLTAFAVHEYRR